jgi:hypothetical protein
VIALSPGPSLRRELFARHVKSRAQVAEKEIIAIDEHRPDGA